VGTRTPSLRTIREPYPLCTATPPGAAIPPQPHLADRDAPSAAAAAVSPWPVTASRSRPVSADDVATPTTTPPGGLARGHLEMPRYGCRDSGHSEEAHCGPPPPVEHSTVTSPPPGLHRHATPELRRQPRNLTHTPMRGPWRTTAQRQARGGTPTVGHGHRPTYPPHPTPREAAEAVGGTGGGGRAEPLGDGWEM